MRVRNLRTFVLFLSTFFLAGCVSMEKPTSFTDQLVYASKSIEAVAETASAMVERGRLTKEQGREALALIDQAVASLDLARASQGKGDITTAQGQLNLALTLLTQVESYLKDQEGK
jgi:enamine deaminase RidA (YjgF/YER057c/UK114 family)